MAVVSIHAVLLVEAAQHAWLSATGRQDSLKFDARDEGNEKLRSLWSGCRFQAGKRLVEMFAGRLREEILHGGGLTPAHVSLWLLRC
jgi:hypothetical protein